MKLTKFICEFKQYTPADVPDKQPKTPKRHLIGNKWIRRPVKTLGCIVVLLLLVPVLLYIPAVQDFAVRTATRIAGDKTGMKIGIDRLRLKFPVDISLQGVSVIEASGDTMVLAKEVIADIKMRPLLKLDVQINRLRLSDAYYRMLSPDSSMLMTIKAGLLDVDSKSSADIRTSTIALNEATVKDGDMFLGMNVWKQTSTPPDSTSTPFYITAGRLNLENINFTMSMLPAIDTLNFSAKSLTVEKGVVDLRTNSITLGNVKAADGTALMLAPSLEYVKTHPAPEADTTSVSAPTIVKADRISLSGFDARYAVKDSPEVKGFDANDIRVSGLDIDIENFYNEASSLSLPVVSLRAMEQCGLTITEGNGTFSMDSTGMMLKDFNILTPFSRISATAALPNALLAMQPEALLDVDIDASLGMKDIDSFMPGFSAYTGAVPAGTPLNAKVKAAGRLGDAEISRLDIALPGTLSLRAKGNAKNALDIKKLDAKVTFDGELTRPGIIKKFVPMEGIEIPVLSLSGHATALRENYTAGFKALTPQGQLAAQGKAGMNSENYNLSAAVRNLDVGYFTGDPAIGPVSASLTASGAGFNPEKRGAHTDVRLDLASAVYNNHELKDIVMLATLQDGGFRLHANSDSPLLAFDIEGDGTIAENDYRGDITANLRNIDLMALGLSETKNGGSAVVRLKGSASPKTWIYDVDLSVSKLDWQLETRQIAMPDTVSLRLVSGATDTRCLLAARGAGAEFNSPSGLKGIADRFGEIGSFLPKMLEAKRLDVEMLESKMPPFTLKADVAGNGVASELLGPSGMSFEKFTLDMKKDSLINGDMRLCELSTGSMRLDTITLNLDSRGNLIDYKIHLGNRPDTFDEFAQVNMSGYFGENRLSAFLMQHNIKGKTGYKLGFTASLVDSIMSLRFTPLKATIAYMPWKFNLDNFIDLNINNKRLNANLMASSDRSSILVKSEPGKDGIDNLHVNLDNIQVEDFLHMMLNPPPVTASVNSDILVRYTGKALVGKGNLSISDLRYDRQKVGNFELTLQAGMGNKGKSAGKVGMLVEGKEAAAVQFVLVPDSLSHSGGMLAERLKLALTDFPLAIANPFFPPRTMKLSGGLNGDMSLSGSLSKPVLNGRIACRETELFVNMLGTNFKFGNDSITVSDNVLDFHNFDIYAVNDNPLTIKGTVNAKKFSDIRLDLAADAKNMQITGAKGSNGDVTGKLFVDLGATVKGPMSMMDINASLNVLPSTDVTYDMAMSSEAMAARQRADGVVEFVNFNDTTKVQKADSIPTVMGMRVTAQAIISQGTQITVNLGDAGKVECNPSGTLNYFQNYLGDMKLNGTLYTGTGYANYSVPLLGKKNFNFRQNSHITWNGDIMNPLLDIDVYDNLKTNIQMNGNTRLVNFLVTLAIGNTLSAPSVVFDLSTDDDVSISNELQSMTSDQRQQQAINLLLTGSYTGPSAKTVNSSLATSSLYSVLTSSLNSLIADNVKGVDINFGVDQYQTGTNGNTSTNTSYSYQVSKSLINNRFKILVGGNYSTDASADENFQQNLISDIAFEYILRQTNNMSLNARLFRHTGFESVLEGEITETGVGLSLRRRLAYFTEITHFGLSKLWKKKKKPEPQDSVPEISDAVEALPSDTLKTVIRKEDDDEKQ